NNHEIDIFVSARDIWQRLDRPDVGIKIKRFAQADIDRCKAFADRRHLRALERDFVSLDRLDSFLRKRRAKFIERLRTEYLRLPLYVDTGRFDNTNRRGGYFGANSVA